MILFLTAQCLIFLKIKAWNYNTQSEIFRFIMAIFFRNILGECFNFTMMVRRVRSHKGSMNPGDIVRVTESNTPKVLKIVGNNDQICYVPKKYILDVFGYEIVHDPIVKLIYSDKCAPFITYVLEKSVTPSMVVVNSLKSANMFGKVVLILQGFYIL